MGKYLFDWAKEDFELSEDSKIINFPISEDLKDERAIDALERGFTYSDKGMLQKEIEIKVRRSEEVFSYDPKFLKVEEKSGRKYVLDEDGRRVYIDDLGNVYHLRSDIKGENIEEYIDVGNSQILIFMNPEHTVGFTEDGEGYEYDFDKNCYVYNPDVILFKDNTPKR